ncbi:MAG TPA: hypothetical protein VLF41_00080 [Candidatus Nanoarchaeia archaeon]|nr:hypothetical protein [Candidatus Nanoarchaeia archaeon]
MNLQSLQEAYQQRLKELRRMQPPPTWQETVDDFRQLNAAD